MEKKIATTHRRRGGVIIKQIAEASTAAECGLEPGDKILAIDGNTIPDSLSFSFNITKPELVMEVEKSNGEKWQLEIEKDVDTSFGVTLEEDPIMLCRNKCIFCFVDQNPKGYRKSLLIKDEDIRLSFMYGNYSTLSSTDQAEEERIIREKINPLYISVHATDPVVRVFMLKNKKTGDIAQRLERLAAGGIQFHTQIVLCPGVNDGTVLERTLNDLADLHPACLSIAVVPLGITSSRLGLTRLTPVDDTFCRETIAFCHEKRDEFKQRLNDPMVYLGDEFYLRAGIPIPSTEHYRDFPQIENGVGMVRRFLDGFAAGLDQAGIPAGTKGTLVTGDIFGPILADCAKRINHKYNTQLRVAPIRNDAFGPDLITVAGLVTGGDTMAQISDTDLGDFVILPHVMLKDPLDPLLLDDLRPEDLARSLKVPIVGSGNSAAELFQVLAGWQDHVLAYPRETGCDTNISRLAV